VKSVEIAYRRYGSKQLGKWSSGMERSPLRVAGRRLA
jgi:hypothetical protein